MLDYKDNYLLNLLVSSDYSLTIDDIQKLLGISQRSAYYSISKINDYLESHGLPKIVNKRNKGIIIEQSIKDILVDLNLGSIGDAYMCTPSERVVLETLFLLIKDEYKNISYFEEIFNVSRNTIVNDIREVRKMIGTFNLSLDFDSFRGYIINGLPIIKRSVILNLISNYEYLVKMKSFDLYTNEIVGKTMDMLRVLEIELNIKYVRTTLVHLSVLLSIIKENKIEPIDLKEEDKTIISNSQEFKAVSKIIGNYFEKKEYYYIALHLMGLRINFCEEYSNQDDEYINEIVEFLIAEFTKITLIYFDKEEELYHHLYVHMKQAMFRFKYGIIHQNDLKDQILKNYPQVSQVVRTICSKLEKKIGFPIGDDDITFISS